MKPYSSARDEFKGHAEVFLDANENSLGSPMLKFYNRYPDPLQQELKSKIASIKHVPAENIFLGNGSDEPIDLIYRCFCEPGRDQVVVFPPTYGMYEVSAQINNVEVLRVPLLSNFQIDMEKLEQAIGVNTKVIWVCSPNNPTGNNMDRQDVEMILNNFDGLVVVDEAYINFSKQRSWLADLADYPNLIVLQTFSKAWGLAGMRLGMAFASTQIIHYLNKVKPPYNISLPVQELASAALEEVEQVNEMILSLVEFREDLSQELRKSNEVVTVYPSDANFILVVFKNANDMYNHLVSLGIVVRDRSNVTLCENALRITVGTEMENRKLIKAIEEYKSKEK